jgi:probable O-glycosylation ligase (exosortase A-associated)
MSYVEATVPWWRPASKQPSTDTRSLAGRATDLVGGRLAFYALVAFTLILILSPQTWVPVLKVFRIAFLAAGLAAAAHVMERTAHRKPITLASPEMALALALVAWAVITVPLSTWPGGSVRLLTDTYLKAIAFFWLLGSIITSTSRLRVLAWTLTLCSIPLALTAVYNYVFGEGLLSTGVDGFYRISGYMGGSGLTGNPNDLALMLNLIVPIAGALLFIERGMKRLVIGGTVLLSVAAIIVTFSRGGFLMLAAIFVMFLAVLVRRRAPGAAVGLLLVALLVPTMLPSGYVDRLGTITNIQADETGSAQGRYGDFLVAVEVMGRNPLTGVGAGQDMIALNQQRGGEDTWRSVHNAYLQYGVDLGIPGMLLFVLLHLTCLRTARKVELRAGRDPSTRDLALLASGIQVSLVAFFVGAFFHPIAYQFYFFAIGGLAVALRHACRAEVARL